MFRNVNLNWPRRDCQVVDAAVHAVTQYVSEDAALPRTGTPGCRVRSSAMMVRLSVASTRSDRAVMPALPSLPGRTTRRTSYSDQALVPRRFSKRAVTSTSPDSATRSATLLA